MNLPDQYTERTVSGVADAIGDANSRWVGKKACTGTSANPVLQTSAAFLFDGWNLVTEVSTSLPSAIGGRQSYV